MQENFHAEDGTVLYQLQLSWPYFAGKAGGVLQVNRFFEDWKNEKLRIYEADGDSIRQAALEIYRESKDSGWTGSWTERYRVSRVCTKGQYVSVLLDSDLKEGNLKKIPHRESYVLDLESGQQVTRKHCWENPERNVISCAGGVFVTNCAKIRAFIMRMRKKKLQR